MQIEFVTIDVFTDRRFGGNPLAVVPDAATLDGAQMQAIAAEFNLAETTFVLPPRDAAHTAEVRIFTPRAELPFAGHPNIGTAFALATLHGGDARRSAEPLLFEEKAGLVRLDLLREGATIVGARLAAPQPLMCGEDVAAQIVAAACGLAADAVATGNHAPCIASCGIPFVLAELETAAALATARPQTEIFAKHVPIDRATGILIYVRRQGGDIAARMFAPLHGIPEDPATGSANVALVGLLASLRPEPDLKLELRIVQGVEMGRPSLLEAAAEKRDGKITGLWIGGRCVPMMRGTLALE
jgi:trans-2,3-dihydro-3-hydroxyanthranilate isomerase